MSLTIKKATTISIPEITKPDIVFGTTKGLPDYDTVPEDFKYGKTKWNMLFNDWFYSGISELRFVKREGIDPEKAYDHIQALIKSFGSKHEHKEAGVAYLLSQYFKDVSYRKKDGTLIEFEPEA
jgi:hypothetical protein